jgi:flagellin
LELSDFVEKRGVNMGLVVNTNIQSLFAQRALSSNTNSLQRSLERLSTGFRINRAADDAAGLSISEKMTSEIKGLEKAKQNASDGISLIQTAEGSLSIIQDNVQRIRELTVQGLNGTNSQEELNAIQREINERVRTIDSIAKATKFNGASVLYNAANTSNIVLQTGASSGESTTLRLGSGLSANEGINIDIDQAEGIADEGHLVEGAVTAGFQFNQIRINGASVGSVDAIDNGGSNILLDLRDVDKVIGNISRMRSYLGAVQNSLESKIEYIDVARENISSSRSRIRDVDVASESSELIKQQILQQSAGAMLGQANAAPQIALNLLPGR